MAITVTVLLILTGIFLLLLEIMVLPGISVAGIGGALFLIAGVIYSYSTFGSTGGHITLATTSIFVILSVVLAFRSKTWKKAMLDTEINSKVDALKDIDIAIGDTGITISRLAPMGKVKVNNKYLEAKSLQGFIDEKTEIEIVKIQSSNILVKPKK